MAQGSIYLDFLYISLKGSFFWGKKKLVSTRCVFLGAPSLQPKRKGNRSKFVKRNHSKTHGLFFLIV